MNSKYIEIVHKFAGVKALVIGDLLVDMFHWGHVDRLSPEAPVPIFIEERREPRRGGADNVAHQLEVLGCDVQTLFAINRSVKHRYFAAHHQVFRLDEDEFGSPTDRQYDFVRNSAEQFDVIVLSDYGKQFLNEEICQLAMGRGVPVVVDPKGTNWKKYIGATVICPNEKEWEAVGLHQPPGTSIVAKHGSKGLAVITEDAIGVQRAQLLPARAKIVFDVVGAGDTVTALIAAGIAVKASLLDSAAIANFAAAVVVSKLGTAVCSKQELLEALQ